jgi:hypothetical protein
VVESSVLFLEAPTLNVQLTQPVNNLLPWKVQSIVKLPGSAGIEVAFSGSRGPVRFQTTDFDVGVRGPKSAALAKFAAAAGFGEVKDIFDFITSYPQNAAGILFSEGKEFSLGDFVDEF